MAVTTGTGAAALTREDGPIETEPRLVVMLHGAFLNPALWDGYANELGDRFRVIAPAYGDSGWGSSADEGGPGVADAAALVAAEIEAAGGHALVVGHSLGGYLALQLSATYPDLVDGLILMDCSTPPHGFATLLNLHLAALEVIPVGVSSFVLGLMVKWYNPEAWTRLVRVGISMGRGARAVRSLRSLDYWGLVRALRCPLLVVNGSRDWLFRANEWQTAGAAERSRVAWIPNAGHLAPVDRRDEICTLIRHFADQLDEA
jgi:pimeloyl-ACP methyl ester carboxylesterase